MNIRKKFVVIPMVITALTILLIIVFSVTYFGFTSKKSLKENQKVLVESMVESVDEYVNKYADVITLLRSFDAVQDISEFDNIQDKYRGLSDQEGLAVRALFKDTINVYPQIAYLETFTKDEAICVVLEPYKAQLNVAKEDYLKGFSHRDWYKGAMEKEDTYVSEAYISASIFRPVVAISTPIFDDQDEIVGIMIGTVELTDLSTIVKSLTYGQTGKTYIIDKNGHLIAHPDEQYFENKTLFKIENNEIINSILENEGQLQSTTKLYDNLTNEDVYVFYKKIHATDWYVISQISVSEAEFAGKQLIRNVSITAFIMLVIITLYLYRHATRALQPIGLLTEISKRVTNGCFNVTEKDQLHLECLSKRTDEIGVLGHSYHIMITNLHDNIKRLQGANQELIDKFDEIEKQKQYIQFLANHDPLTKLPNRRQFNEKLKEALEVGKSGAVVLIDIDNFKSINDTMGHIFGDKVLLALSDKMNKYVSEDVFISRFGGDEFIILLTNVEEVFHGSSFINQLIEEFYQPIEIDKKYIEIRFSIGISRFPYDSTEIDKLIMYADMAMYHVKNKGKNRYHFFDISIKNKIYLRKEVKDTLKEALKYDGFKLVYQPQVDIQSGEVIAYEALLRLKNNRYSPDEFIEIAEENGQIVEIGRWVTREAIKQIAKWKKAGLVVKPVSINFSAVQLRDRDFIDLIKDSIDKYQVEPDLIELEVTESMFIKKEESIFEVFNELHQLGISISMDDFGTGYSSLNYLTFLPISKIKLDRSLCVKFTGVDNIQVIASIISLSHSLNLQVIAEGIEDCVSVKQLKQLGCDAIQGYYFSEPMEAEVIMKNMKMDYKELL